MSIITKSIQLIAIHLCGTYLYIPMDNNNTSDTGIHTTEMEQKDIAFLKDMYHLNM